MNVDMVNEHTAVLLLSKYCIQQKGADWHLLQSKKLTLELGGNFVG